MKLIVFLLTTSSFNICATGISQNVSFSGRNVPLETVFSSVEKQTDFVFMYTEFVLLSSKPVSISAKDVPLEKFLTEIFKSQPLEYCLKGKSIFITAKPLVDKLFDVSSTLHLTDEPQLSIVKGKVVDEQNQPLIGASVEVKGTKTSGLTDEEGVFSFNVKEGDVLVVSFVGYETKEVPVTSSAISSGNLSVSLRTTNTELNEVVAVGYQTQRKVDLTGAVSVVNVDNLTNSPISNPISALQGQVSGLFITTNGDPSGKATVMVRGYNTLNNNDPLYIIDGVPTRSSAFQILRPTDIQSIQVLKDASSAAIYGARASNGVIIVTTKQASKGRTDIEFSAQTTLSQYVDKPKVLDANGRARAQWQATVNDGLDPDNIPYVDYDWTTGSDGTPVLNGLTIPEFLSPGWPSANTNWFDEITRTGMVQDYNLSISSGRENGGSFMSLGYLKNDYTHKFKDYQKLSAKINSYHNLFNNKVKVGQNLTITNGINNGFVGADVYSQALLTQPVLPVKLSNGEYSGPMDGNFVDQANPVQTLDINRSDKISNLNIFGNVYANISILKNLILNTSVGIENAEIYTKDIQRTFTSGFIRNAVNSLRNEYVKEFNLTANATLQYLLTKNKHEATFLLGTELIKGKNSLSATYKEGFALETDDYFVEDAGSGNQTVAGSASGFSLLSYFGKVNYSYDSRFLGSATLRYDGSSRFGENNRFGFFPAVSFGWRLSEEQFISDNANFISDLKLRAGWGRTGNQEIANTARFELFETLYGQGSYPFQSDDGTAYDITGADGGSLASGLRRMQRGNENLKWESTTELNIGLDFGFFNQKISGSVEFFDRSINDILISPNFLAAVGEGGNQFVNGASVKNTGYEFSLTYRNTIGGFNYSVTGNLGHYNDRVTKLPENVLNTYPGNVEQPILGHSATSYFGYVADGLFKTQREVDESPTQIGKGLGRIRYKDLNGDGTVDFFDQKFLGNYMPRYSYGLDLQGGYKKFSIRVFFQGVAGITAYDNAKRYSDFTDLWAGTNYGTRVLDAWTPSNSNSTIPALTLTDNNNEGRQSTYFVSNGVYVKLRQVSIAYTVNKIFHLKDARVFLTGDNLLTFKDNKGSNAYISPDPENPSLDFPRPRNITLGLNLLF